MTPDRKRYFSVPRIIKRLRRIWCALFHTGFTVDWDKIIRQCFVMCATCHSVIESHSCDGHIIGVITTDKDCNKCNGRGLIISQRPGQDIKKQRCSCAKEVEDE